MRDGGVDADGKVVVDNVVRLRVAFVAFLRLLNSDLPPIHVDLHNEYCRGAGCHWLPDSLSRGSEESYAGARFRILRPTSGNVRDRCRYPTVGWRPVDDFRHNQWRLQVSYNSTATATSSTNPWLLEPIRWNHRRHRLVRSRS